MTFADYIKPELLILVPVLYVLGAIIKDSEAVPNKYIPAILGACGTFLALLYVLGSAGFSATGVFTGITQGILIAGAAVYTHEFITQLRKDDEEKPPAAEGGDEDDVG